jgi:hypothetical protein
MQNKEFLKLNAYSHSGREVYRKGDEIIWAANGNDGDYYLAQFNVGENEVKAVTPLSFIGLKTDSITAVTEIWDQESVILSETKEIVSSLRPHSVKLFKISCK